MVLLFNVMHPNIQTWIRKQTSLSHYNYVPLRRTPWWRSELFETWKFFCPTKLVSMHHHSQSHGVVFQCDASKCPSIDQRADNAPLRWFIQTSKHRSESRHQVIIIIFLLEEHYGEEVNCLKLGNFLPHKIG